MAEAKQLSAETFHEQAARLGYEAHTQHWCNVVPWAELDESDRDRWIASAAAIEKFVVRTLGRSPADQDKE